MSRLGENESRPSLISDVRADKMRRCHSLRPVTREMIRVLNVIDTGGPGGAETVFLDAATRLDPARFESTAVVGGDGWLAAQLRRREVTPHIVSAKGAFNVRYLLALRRLARRNGIDVILAHLYGSAIYASMVGSLLSIPVVSVLHGHTDVPGSERFSSLKGAIIRQGSSKVVFVSERLEQHLRSRLGLTTTQCAVISNGVDTGIFAPAKDRSLRAEIGISDDTALIGAIGNVRKPKAYDILLQAVQALIKRSLRFHLVIAGDCTNALGRQLELLRHELDLDRHVTFLGLRPDVPRILNNLDVFVLSSHTEGFSIACIEAMACGVPVVATRSGGPEQILEGEAGVLVPTGEPESLAIAIERVVSSKDLTEALVATATKRVHEQYSLTTMLARYEALLERVTQN